MGSGVMMKWGSAVIGTGGSHVFTFVGPVFTTIYSAQNSSVIAGSNDPRGTIQSVTTTTITIINSSSVSTLNPAYYLVIGV
jgi:hypothetical protein